MAVEADTKPAPLIIGYAPAELTSALAFPSPRLLLRSRSAPLSYGAVQACPAVNTFESRTIEMVAPFSLRLRCLPNARKGFDFHLVDDGTRVNDALLDRHLKFMKRKFWRDANTPVVQIALPHFFVCDETCYLTQAPPWASKAAAQMPGRFISGRFPTDIWPRSVNVAFEWTDLERDFVMKRGDAVCYFLVESLDPLRPIRLVEAKLTAELLDYRKQIEDVAKYTSGTFNLFAEAKKVRPAQLLHEARA